jgi:hypothetical protein
MPVAPVGSKAGGEIHCVGVVTPKKHLTTQWSVHYRCLPFVNNHDQELVNVVPERTMSKLVGWSPGEYSDGNDRNPSSLSHQSKRKR